MMLYSANEVKTIGNIYFEDEGLATCVQKWNTANICKRKTEGMLHMENNQKNCGAPPLIGEDFSGLNPPMLSTD